MILFLLSYLGGVLTILSPCILPVLPFVFARADRPFLRSGLPLLLGMTVSFAVIASLATVSGAWVVQANQAGRILALGLLALFGLTLLLPSVAERLTRPLVELGNRLSTRADGEDGVGGAVLLGVATGLLWAPCAGPILGLILTGAAINGATASTTLLLLAYALGAATSLGLALLAGGKVFAAMKRGLGVGEWVRRALGVLVLAGVAAIALGLDTGLLARLSQAQTAGLEQVLLKAAGMGPQREAVAVAGSDLPVEGVMPPLSGVTWLNAPPLTREGLRGKVVLIDFWTYSCINCIRTIPYLRAWHEKYAAQGLVVIGMHTPEFAFEKAEANVRRAMRELGVTWAVAQDNDFAVWRAFKNQYWPAHYFIDAQGRIRHHHYGEGEYDRSEKVIQQLLAEAGAGAVPGGIVAVKAGGAQAAPDFAQVKSPETYIGYNRGANFAATPFPVRHDTPATYAMKPSLALNQWGLSGVWTIGPEMSKAEKTGAKITFRFQARDLHLVLGPGSDAKPVRFRVTLDGLPPKDAHGDDADAQGVGTVTTERLYQLIRQKGPIRERTFQIEFLDPGVQAFAFTFG